MFVGDKNSVELINRNVAGGEAGQRFAFAEAAIDEEAGALRFEQRNVSRTAGSQNGNAQADRGSSKISEPNSLTRQQREFLG
jgi:hypothetical protein